MKKLTSLMMAAALAVSITACGATANTNAAASSATDKSTATAEAGNETVTITYPEYMIPGVMSDSTDEERMKARSCSTARVFWKLSHVPMGLSLRR